MKVADLVATHRSTAALLGAFVGAAAEQQRRLTAPLRPRDEDYDLVFDDAVAGAARAAYRLLWTTRPAINAGGGSELRLLLALSGMPVTPPGFPSGYDAIRPHLRPGVLWSAWSYVAGGEPAAAYDGLVCFPGRWAWFPSPWLFIGPLAVVGRPSPLTHWVE